MCLSGRFACVRRDDGGGLCVGRPVGQDGTQKVSDLRPDDRCGLLLPVLLCPRLRFLPLLQVLVWLWVSHTSSEVSENMLFSKCHLKNQFAFTRARHTIEEIQLDLERGQIPLCSSNTRTVVNTYQGHQCNKMERKKGGGKLVTDKKKT